MDLSPPEPVATQTVDEVGARILPDEHFGSSTTAHKDNTPQTIPRVLSIPNLVAPFWGQHT
jgi:hypothetical protein